MPDSQKANIWLSEEQVIDIITSKSIDGKSLLHYNFNLISSPFEIDESEKYIGYYVAKNILRQDMGFEKNQKPGDFDLLIIPFSALRVYFERTIATEVKVVRPTRQKPGRNSNSDGIEQTKGLIEDGFPLISLFHIVMTEPLLESEKLQIKRTKVAANSGLKIDTENLENNFEDIKVDFFPWISTDLQMKRLITSDLPKYVSLQCLSIDIDKDGRVSYSYPTNDLRFFEKGYFNPHNKSTTIKKIKKHFENTPEKYEIQYI